MAALAGVALDASKLPAEHDDKEIMKRSTPLSFALCVCFGLVACDGDSDDGSGDTDTDPTPTATSMSTTDPTAGSGDSESTTGDETATDVDPTDGSTSDDSVGTGTTDPTGSTDPTDPTSSGTDGSTGSTDDVPRVGTMKEYLDDAMRRASASNANAALVVITAAGIEADGTVDLDSDGFVRRWTFGYDDENNDVAVMYIDSGAPDFPTVENPAGNVVPMGAAAVLTDPQALPDSDAVMSTFTSVCPNAALGGDIDSLTYNVNVDTGAIQVTVFTSLGANYVADVDGDTLTEVFSSCGG